VEIGVDNGNHAVRMCFFPHHFRRLLIVILAWLPLSLAADDPHGRQNEKWGSGNSEGQSPEPT
jgi:hypothetical protein